MKKFTFRRFAPALLLGMLTIIGSACQSSNQEDENPLSEEEQESAEVRPEVTFAIADSKPIYQYIESQGVVQANQSVTLKPKISGYVEQSYITEGKRVQKGDTLLKFDRREYAISVDEAMNAYDEALEKYKIEMGLRAGADSTVGTNGNNSTDPGSRLVRITTGLAQAELDLKRARLNLSYTSLVAPFSGILFTEERITPGAYVGAGTQVGRLVDDRKVRIRFDVLESELSNIDAGMEVRLTAPGGEQMQGTVQAVSPVVNTETKTGTVIVEADNEGRILTPGMTVEGRIQVRRQEGKVRVPRSAILSRDGGRTLLFKLHPENNEVQWVYVEPTAQNSQWSIVDHEQVAPGDTIAVDRHFSLSHLQIVDPVLEVPE
jgi:RND family efflux transporter MFP subunit